MYVSLHNRSAYSFGTSLITPRQLVEQAVAYGMPAVALTDFEGLYAAVEFFKLCRAADITPILGMELRPADTVDITVLARGRAGYGQLCQLASLRHLRGRSVTLPDLAEYAADLICMIGHAERAALLSRDIDRLRAVFGERLYVELCPHGAGDIHAVRRRAHLADELAVAVVAGCAARCLRRDQMPLLGALQSIGTLTLLDEPHPDKGTGTWHLRSPAEMAHLFRRRPDAVAATHAIAEQCALNFDLTRNRFPAFSAVDGRPAIAHLAELAEAGCRWRYVDEPPLRGIGGKRATLDEALRRLRRELAIIEQVHYAEYFLVFHEIVQYCNRQGIATLARGSAADSLVCYVLGVSHACPFRFDLPFDRFVNPERARFSKMADIDLDLPWDQRDQVIEWVYERYGHDRVAMIGAANTYRARGAVAELGKVFGLAPSEVHQATRVLSYMTASNLPRSIARSPEARHLPVDEEPYRTIVGWAGALHGLPRHWSMHPCGLVVSPEPLDTLIPLQRSAKGPVVAQYDMDAVEDLGFVKVDLLGQAGLAVLRDAVGEIERTTGQVVDLAHDVDYSDVVTWDMIAGGQARGVHHIESPAMTSLIVQCACRDIDCLTTIVAIIRPGAANQGKKEAFARRYQGLEPPGVVHPAIRDVLRSTYGLMVFEEHILQVAVEFAGMNIGRADVLRRALNKHNVALVASMRAEFEEHALEIGRTLPEIDEVWTLLEGFSGFMFNKAHSAEYAVEAFQGAWIKHRWPAHYIAAILSNYRGFYAHSPTMPQILYVFEARRMGAEFRAPCVNRSRARFAVEYHDDRPAIRLPVAHITGLSCVLIERHLAERAHGSFKSLTEFCTRCRPGLADARLLLDAGALDVFGLSRPALFWELQVLLKCHRDGLMFDPIGPDGAAPPIELSSPDEHSVVQREMDVLGFPVSVHPLDHLGGAIEWSRYIPVERLAEHLNERVAVCGLMVADRTNATTGGDLMKFVTLGDYTGFIETILFPDVYQRCGHLLVGHPILAAEGVVEPFENSRGFTLRVVRVMQPALRAADHAASG